MPTIRAHGLTAEAASGWDAQIYVRPALPAEALAQPPTGSPNGPPGGSGAGPGATLVAGVAEETRPILHLANFGLPPGRADFGGGAVELMESGAVFIAVIEHDTAAAESPLFLPGIPWPLRSSDFSPEQMQRTLPGQAGCQRFFTVDGRAFCLYVVLGSYRNRELLTKVVNDALARIELR